MSHSERPAALNSPKLIRGQQDPCVIPAEMSGATIIAIELQWGRDQLSAEIGDRRGTGRVLQLASMGPRSADRGNDHGLAESVDRSPRLQWGRDQLIAEMKSQGISRAVLARFNGAAIS